MSALDRRRFLRTAGAGTALASLLGAGAAGTAAAAADTAPAPAPRARRHSTTARLRWLGTSGWRLEAAGATLLVDPYLSRYPTGLFTGKFDPTTGLKVRKDVVDRHMGDPSLILVTHSHWDHFNDVPYIAKSTGARVVGTSTTAHLAQAMKVDTAQLSAVKGGEVFDFPEFVVEVVPSLHSRNGNYSMAFPGSVSAPPATEPATIADLPEGDTLCFQVRVKGGPSIFFMGASDFAERSVAGLTPDVAMIALPSSSATHDYVPRLIRALGKPPTVVPVHWDDFEVPLKNPPVDATSEAMGPEEFAAKVEEVAPGTKVVIPEYLTPYTFG
ncbi:MBL fold metallo-hydrolase [Streptomonospora nanhaiensis]|uniref:MBL fold metallo-hydrolase n=1 Tax=Streptomonospora nanhaiensis TaxID=1323731 RepID=UPI001C99A7EA|nr:MBL fold metallo-hydrolase [Streptomonospora nanhaiensis]MBX9389635.1 MBL fold metallo-hydrolase [Streptomonospora nanhaiensis]